ncbi:MAG: tyrosine-type recombinase/integrase [Trebonia sp.]|uniref:tyrosine-type recombinase/integrase n=1 Tax=Trebonia sp. TaxID=2767075 RepID=UPI003BAE6151
MGRSPLWSVQEPVTAYRVGTNGPGSLTLGAGDPWTDLDLVFTTRHSTPIERTEDWRAWKAILRQAQVRDARVHDARHTAATLLIAQGVHIRVVQEVLGHTRVTTTERYTHVATLQMKDASERMDQALWGPG